MHPMRQPDAPERVIRPTYGCLVLVQVAGAHSLGLRAPAGLERGLLRVQELLVEAVTAHGGALVQSAADGWAAWFDGPLGAARASVQVQEQLLHVEWPQTLLARPEAAEVEWEGRKVFRGLRVRVAVHCGRVVRRGEWVSGPAVYEAARVLCAAHGGQTLLSQIAWARVRGALGRDVVVRDLGAHQVLGGTGERRLVQVLPTALDARTFPVPNVENLLHSNVSGEAGPALQDADLTSLVELVKLGVRLVTVSGHALRRSRIVRSLAWECRGDPRLAGGVWLVRMPVMVGVPQLVRGVADVLGVGLSGATREVDAVVQLGHALAARGPMLLVLDRLGSPQPSTAEALGTWLELAPRVTVVAAAAGRIAARGEVNFSLSPMLAPSAADVLRSDSVRLYDRQARRVDRSFQLGSGEEVAALVARVGAHPLSIRLLAGAVERVPLIDQLDAVSGSTTPAEIMRVAWDALTGSERDALSVCTLHAGTFESVGLPENQSADEEYGLVAQLHRMGWLVEATVPAGPKVRRYAVTDEVRMLVLGVLSPDRLPELRAARDDRVLRQTEQFALDADRRDHGEVISRIAMEWPDLLLAIIEGSAADSDAAGLDRAVRGLLTLGPVLVARGPLFIGLALADRVAGRFDGIFEADPLQHVRVLTLRAALQIRARRAAATTLDLERAVSIARRWSDVDGRAKGVMQQGWTHWQLGKMEACIDAFTEAFAAFAVRDDPVGEATAGCALGAAELALGRFADAEAHLRAALETLRERGARRQEAHGLVWLAVLHRRQDRFEEAASLFREAVEAQVEEGATSMAAQTLADLAMIDLHLDRVDRAGAALGRASDLARRIGDEHGRARVASDRGLVAISRGARDEAREWLLSALAIHRALGDVAAEGRDTGLLGILHHLDDQPDAARGFYAASLELLQQAQVGRLEALFCGWLANLEVEAGELDLAKALFARADERLAQYRDPQVARALEYLRAALEWATAVRDGPAPSGRALLDRLGYPRSRGTPMMGEARLALERVAEFIEEGERDFSA